MWGQQLKHVGMTYNYYQELQGFQIRRQNQSLAEPGLCRNPVNPVRRRLPKKSAIQHRKTPLASFSIMFSSYSQKRSTINLSTKPPNLFSEDYMIPSTFDVLYGKGRDALAHVGNKIFRMIISWYRDEYQNAKHRDEKTRISKESFP